MYIRTFDNVNKDGTKIRIADWHTKIEVFIITDDDTISYIIDKKEYQRITLTDIKLSIALGELPKLALDYENPILGSLHYIINEMSTNKQESEIYKKLLLDLIVPNHVEKIY